jgi:hypothetical protein
MSKQFKYTPANGNLRMYNMFPYRRYTESAGIDGMTEYLPEIAKMGFNAVWINPFQETGTKKQENPDPDKKNQPVSGSLYAMNSVTEFNPLIFPNCDNHQSIVKIRRWTATARLNELFPLFDLVLNHIGINEDNNKSQLTILLEKNNLLMDKNDPRFLKPGDEEKDERWPDIQEIDYYSSTAKKKGLAAKAEDLDNKKIDLAFEILWEPLITKYIKIYGFMGIRADALTHVPMPVQKKAYDLVQKLVKETYGCDAIIIGELMIKDPESYMENLSACGLTHSLHPCSFYWGHNTDGGYENEADKSPFIEQNRTISEVILAPSASTQLSRYEQVVISKGPALKNMPAQENTIYVFQNNEKYSLCLNNKDKFLNPENIIPIDLVNIDKTLEANMTSYLVNKKICDEIDKEIQTRSNQISKLEKTRSPQLIKNQDELKKLKNKEASFFKEAKTKESKFLSDAIYELKQTIKSIKNKDSTGYTVLQQKITDLETEQQVQKLQLLQKLNEKPEFSNLQTKITAFKKEEITLIEQNNQDIKQSSSYIQLQEDMIKLTAKKSEPAEKANKISRKILQQIKTSPYLIEQIEQNEIPLGKEKSNSPQKNIGGLVAVIGNHDVGTLKAKIMLDLALSRALSKAKNDGEKYHAYETYNRFKNKIKGIESTNDLKNKLQESFGLNNEEIKQFYLDLNLRMREKIFIQAMMCSGGWYMLAGDELGVCHKPEVFNEFAKNPERVGSSLSKRADSEWQHHNLKNFITGINKILSELPHYSFDDIAGFSMHYAVLTKEVFGSKPAEFLHMVVKQNKALNKTIIIVNAPSSVSNEQLKNKIAEVIESKGILTKENLEIILLDDEGKVSCLEKIVKKEESIQKSDTIGHYKNTMSIKSGPMNKNLFFASSDAENSEEELLNVPTIKKDKLAKAGPIVPLNSPGIKTAEADQTENETEEKKPTSVGLTIK